MFVNTSWDELSLDACTVWAELFYVYASWTLDILYWNVLYNLSKATWTINSLKYPLKGYNLHMDAGKINITIYFFLL